MTTTIDTQTAQLLAHLRRGGTYTYFWSASAKKNAANTTAVWKRTDWSNGTGPKQLPVDQHPEHGALNLYFGVHPTLALPKERMRGGKLKPITNIATTRALVDEIAAINCLFGEFDAKDFGDNKAAVWAHVEQLPAAPSVIIDSGGGYHCYWLFDEPFLIKTPADREHACDIQKRWVAFVNSDDDSKDLARPLRIPGTLNYKYDPPRPITYVSADFTRLYTLDTLEGELPPEAPQNTPIHADVTGRDARRAQAALARLSTDRYEYGKWIDVGMALASLGDPGRDLWIEWSRQGPKFDESVCLEKWPTFKPDGKRTLKSLFYWADQDSPDPRPRIGVRDLDIPAIVKPAWEALVAANTPPTLFRRDNVLYELEKDDTGALLMTEVDKRRLRGRLARVALFEESREKRGEVMTWIVEPPSPILDDMLTRVDPRIPVLTRVVRCPIVAANGAILDTAGYHASAHIYYDPRADVTIPAIPRSPSNDDLQAALALVSELLTDFAFADTGPDRAHAIALFLLPFCRELIDGPTPLHLIEAPVMGSGKSLLARALLLPALGRSPASFTEGENEAEWRKRLTSILATTPATFFIDNINKELAGGQLSAALTETLWSDRLLGTNHTMTAPIRCVWVATANNPTLSGEIARRCIRIRIDPRVDRPWQRDGFKHANLIAWVTEKQGDLIAAALTIIRYGLEHGEKPVKTLGSFEHWAALIGRILGAAEIPGFLGNLDELYDRADSEGTAWRALVGAWWEEHQGTILGAGQVFELYKEGDYDLNLKAKDDRSLKVAFSKRLSKQRDRVVGDYQVVSVGTVNHAQQWKLKPMKVMKVMKVSPLPPVPTCESYENGVYEEDVPEGF